ncbi:MAG: aspartate/glutamate racemase family protein [Stomatobaculum sp.]
MKHPHVTILQTSFAKRDDTVAFLQEKVPGVKVEFITDSTILADVRKNGGPTEAVFARMKLYAKAAEISGADLIVNSCSTVGEVADVYAKEVGIPVMKVEEPMCREAAALGTRFAIIGTVETSMGPVARIIERLGKEEGKVMDCRLSVQKAAWDALVAGKPEEHNRILLENIRKLDEEGYDAIVMSQVSMRALLPELKDLKTPILCSFYSGYGAVADRLNALAQEN